MWILLHADDISLACVTAEKLREAVTTMDITFLHWGLIMSTKKMQVLVVGRMLQLSCRLSHHVARGLTGSGVLVQILRQHSHL